MSIRTECYGPAFQESNLQDFAAGIDFFANFPQSGEYRNRWLQMNPHLQPPFRPRSRKWILAVAAVFVVGAVAFFWSRLRPEPRHQGRSVKDWLEQAAGPATNFDTAQSAISQMGSAAVPSAIRALGDKPGVFDALYEKVYPKLPPAAQEKLSRPVAPEVVQFFAVTALFTNQAVHDHLDTLVPLLTNQQQSARFFSGILLEEHVREGDTNCIPGFIAQLDDSDKEVRSSAIQALRNKWLAPAAPAAVPKLVKLLNDPDPEHEIPIMAAVSLAMIDSNKVTLATQTLKDCVSAMIKERAAEGIPDFTKDFRVANDPVRTGALDIVLMFAANRGKLFQEATSEPPYAAVIRIAGQLFPKSDKTGVSLEQALTIIAEKHPDSEIADASRVVLKKIRKGE